MFGGIMISKLVLICKLDLKRECAVIVNKNPDTRVQYNKDCSNVCTVYNCQQLSDRHKRGMII